LPALAAKAANAKTTPHPTIAVLHAPVQNMYVRRTHLHHVLPHLTRAEEAPTAAAITETTAQALQAAPSTEAIPLLREVLLQAQAVAQAVVIVAEAAAQVQVPQTTAQVQVATALAEAVEAQAVEEDNLLSASEI